MNKTVYKIRYKMKMKSFRCNQHCEYKAITIYTSKRLIYVAWFLFQNFRCSLSILFQGEDHSITGYICSLLHLHHKAQYLEFFCQIFHFLDNLAGVWQIIQCTTLYWVEVLKIKWLYMKLWNMKLIKFNENILLLGTGIFCAVLLRSYDFISFSVHFQSFREGHSLAKAAFKGALHPGAHIRGVWHPPPIISESVQNFYC